LAEYEGQETTSDPQEPLNTKIQRKKQELNQAITSGRKSTAHLRKEIELLEKIQALENQINQLQAQEATYQQQIRQQEEQIQAKQEQITQLQSQTQQKQAKITQLEGQIRDLNAEKNALQERMMAERQEALAQ
jgi:chromosome segregation ATPase